MIDDYQQLPDRLYAGDIDECFRFLDARNAQDGHTPDYWHWRAVAHLRAGEFQKALDICCYITRHSDSFGFQIHCMADVCAHLGLKEVGLAMIDYYAIKPGTHPLGRYLWRVYGWHYLGEDARVLQISPDGIDAHSAYVLGHHQGRSAMRLNGIAGGVDLMHRYWSSHDARRVLFPHVDLEGYWCGQRTLPAHMTLKSIASGQGDQVNWVRYISALEALGVQIAFADGSQSTHRVVLSEAERTRCADALRAAGFVVTEGAQWTEPFALFTSLFPVLGYASTQRYIEPAHPSCVDTPVDDIRQRAGGRRCVGIFWSSCESANNFASRSLRLEDLHPLFDNTEDIHWVIMQRGYEYKRWLNDPRAADLDRFTTLPPDLHLAHSVTLIDKLDAFVGNDGGLSHFAGALGKPNYLFLNQVAEWRYERDPDVTPWYPTTRLVRAGRLGDWDDVVRKLRHLLTADAP